MNNFPCEDLRTIDQLWVEYSNGRFGFSVQKKIWLEVGGKVDYETECKLGDRVGWRKNSNWMKYSDLAFSLQAPVGHFPYFRGWFWRGVFGALGSGLGLVTVVFVSHVKNCKL
ncbi:GUN4 domain-containing protein [Planktothrix mougeotii]|uniref:GUN4 domain-containing protein n=1 Tax=Planktothrix mougeotii TaxID=54306 RepID=UPI002AD460FB|nr:GUN4 domain-containing protein [Planktothrix mougeotii]